MSQYVGDVRGERLHTGENIMADNKTRQSFEADMFKFSKLRNFYLNFSEYFYIVFSLNAGYISGVENKGKNYV